jgi:hypothetical protein
MGKLRLFALAIALTVSDCWVMEHRPDCPDVLCTNGLDVRFSPSLRVPGTYLIAVDEGPATHHCEAVVELVQSGTVGRAGGCPGASAGAGGEPSADCESVLEARVTQPGQPGCFTVMADEAGIQFLAFSDPLPDELTVTVSRDGRQVAAETLVPAYPVIVPDGCPACRNASEDLSTVQ